MTDTCLKVLKRWGLNIKREDLSFISLTPDPQSGKLEEVDLSDIPANGSFFSIFQGRITLDELKLSTSPRELKITRAHHLANFGHVFKGLEESFVIGVASAFNPLNAATEVPVNHWIYSNSDYLNTLTQAGFDPERVSRYFLDQVALIPTEDIEKMLSEVYGLNHIKPGDETAYLDVSGLSQAQLELFRRAYFHLTSCVDDDFNGQDIFEMPLSALKKWVTPNSSSEDFEPFEYYQTLTGPDYTQDARGERKIELSDEDLSIFPIVKNVYLKPDVSSEKEAEFNETLKVMAKEMSFDEALKSAYYLSLNS